MSKIEAIAWKDLRVAFADWQRWLRMFLLPALAIYLIGLGTQELAHGFTPAIVIAVLNQDNTPTSQAFLAEVARGHEALVLENLTPSPLSLPPADGGAGEGRRGEDLTPLSPSPTGRGGSMTSPSFVGKGDGGLSAATLIIPAGFEAALEEGRPVTLAFTPGAGLVAPAIASAAVHNAALRLGGPIIAAGKSTALAGSLDLTTDPDFYAARLAEAQASWDRPPIRVVIETAGARERATFGAQLMENGFRLSTPSIAAMFVMISLLNLAQLLTEERTSGILRRMGMMPMRRSHLLAGHLLAGTLMGWSQFAVMIGFGMLLGVHFGPQPWPALVVAAAYALTMAALSLTLAALARTPSQATALATLTWLVLAPLGGAWWPLLLVPDWMRTLGHLSPVAWCLDALNALVFGSGGWAEIVQPMGVLLLFAAVFFIIGATRFNYQQPGSNDPALICERKLASIMKRR